MTYAQSTALSRSNYNRAQMRRHPSYPGARVKEDALKPMSNFITILVLVCLLIVIYLLQVNTTNSYSYVIDDLNRQQTQLREEYESLAVEATKLESNERVTSHDSAAGYSLPANVYFDQ